MQTKSVEDFRREAERDARRTALHNKIAAVFGIFLALYILAFHPEAIVATIHAIFR